MKSSIPFVIVGATTFVLREGQQQLMKKSFTPSRIRLKSPAVQQSGKRYTKILRPTKLTNGTPRQTRTEPATLLNAEPTLPAVGVGDDDDASAIVAAEGDIVEAEIKIDENSITNIFNINEGT